MKTTQYSLNENLIIKYPIPNIGIICSNPKRAHRIAHNCLDDVTLITKYQSAWPLDLYIGSYQNQTVFIAAIAIGASGAAFAIQQLSSAGAKYIIRFGSNDNPNLTLNDMHNVVLVDSADNLHGLMHGNGEPSSEWGKLLYADTELINNLSTNFKNSGMATNNAICHHVEDYAAYAFPALHPNHAQIKQDISKLEAQSIEKLHCRDMESAALFYRASIDDFAAATVLQNVPKYAGTHQTYDKEAGTIARSLEPKIANLILDTLIHYGTPYQDTFLTYTKLNKKNIHAYLNHVTNNSYLDANITEIGNGNLNQIFRITTNNSNFIIKQALPYLRCVGESYALDKIRMKYEVGYFQIATNICKDHIPQIYYTDDNQMMTIHMEDLNNHQLLRDGLINSFQYPILVNHLTKFLATILFKTSRIYLNLAQHMQLVKQFNDNKLRILTENFIFTFPYIEHETNYINKTNIFDMKFRNNTQFLLNLFQTNAEALIHGDLHTGSIFVNQEQTVIIDPEFAYMGPIGFDLGLLIANLITAYIHHKVCKDNSQNMQLWLLTTIELVIDNLFKEFKSLWNQSYVQNQVSLFNTTDLEQYQLEYFKTILHSTIGFAGLEICRRICGIAGVKEIREISNLELKQKAETILLDIGIFMVKNFQSVDQVQQLTVRLTNE